MTTWVTAWSQQEGVERATAAFTAEFGYEPAGVYSAPGRVNIIGEHVDYNDGLCLPTALPHRTYIAVGWRDDDQVNLVSGAEPGRWQARLQSVAPGAVSGWGSYVVGVAWALAQAGYVLSGFDAAVESCVPYGAGLSSSAALEAATAIALVHHPHLNQAQMGQVPGNQTQGNPVPGPDLRVLDDVARAFLAQICVRAENEIAGANTGGMDQAASLRAAQGYALLLDCADGTVEHTRFDLARHDLDLLIIDTKTPHALVDGQYAQRRATCEQVADILGVPSLRHVPLDFLPEALDQLPDEVSQRRVQHVVTEIERVREFSTALAAEDFSVLGSLLDASHESLRHDFEVSCVQLDTAVEAARRAGALGARMTGGGFGGSAIALIHLGDHDRVAAAITSAFSERGFADPAFLLAPPSGPAE